MPRGRKRKITMELGAPKTSPEVKPKPAEQAKKKPSESSKKDGLQL